MIIIGGLVVGAILGALLARGRGGNRLDMLQYAAVFGILLGLAGVFLTVYLSRG